MHVYAYMHGCMQYRYMKYTVVLRGTFSTGHGILLLRIKTQPEASRVVTKTAAEAGAVVWLARSAANDETLFALVIANVLSFAHGRQGVAPYYRPHQQQRDLEACFFLRLGFRNGSSYIMQSLRNFITKNVATITKINVLKMI